MGTSDERELAPSLPVQSVSRETSPVIPTDERPSASVPEPRSAQLLISINVLRADGLARGTFKIRELLSGARRFYVAVADGATTKETRAVKREWHSTRWNEVLTHFTINTHSHLTLRLFSRKNQRDDLVGLANLSFEELRVPPRDFGVILDNGTAVQSKESVTLYVGVTVLEPQSLTPRGVINVAERHDQPTGPHAPDISSKLTALIPPPVRDDSPEASLALGALRRANDAMGQMTHASESHTAALEQADGLPDKLSQLGNLYDTWESVIGKIQWIVDITDKIAEVHPYAKMAWSILSFIPKAFLAQVERDRHVQALLQVIHDAFDLLATEGLALSMNSKQKEIMLAMLRHVCDCGDFIQTYAADTAFRERLFANIGRGVEEQVKNYRETLLNLREAFLRQVSVTTGAAVYKVKGGIENISRKLEGIACQIEDIQKDIAGIGLDAKIREIPYGTGSRFRPDKGCIPGTRAAFLEYIVEWANDPDSARTLVLFGQAGTGKSSIAHEVAGRFHDMGRLCSSFVFVRGERSERNSYLLLTTLIRDLCDRYPSFKATLGRVVKSNTSLRLGATDYYTLFTQLLQKPLEDLHLVGPVFVVIDALDESGDVSSRQGLHTFLADHIPQLPSNFRFFITSRPEKRIGPTFSGASSTRIIDIHDPTLSTNAKDDILVYCLQQLRGREPDARRLAAKAERSFQWAAVACDYVQNPPDGLTVELCIDDLLHLSSESKGVDPLDKLYHTVLKARFKFKDHRIHRYYQSVMEQLIAAFEPSSIDTLTSLHRYSQDHDGDETVTSVVGGLGSLLSNVTASDRTLPIVPLHTSFRDFLTDKSRSDEFHIDLRKAHHRMARCSLESMKRELQHNICKLPRSYEANHDIKDLGARISEHIPPSLLYGGRFWDYHLDLADVDPDLYDLVRFILENKLLFWIEYLSIRGLIELVSPALRTVKKWLSSTRDEDQLGGLTALSALIDDALAFARHFAEPIARSAPHIYLSSLPFTPSNSLISSRYAGVFPNVLSVKRGRLSSWPMTEMVIPAHDGHCLSVAFSPDGTRVASGSSDRTIRVWDVITGKLVAGPFRGHTSDINSIAFSPDGLHVVSGSDDSSVRVWDFKTGETLLGPLVGHSASVLSVSFSPNGQRVASSSADQTIRVWDARSGAPVAGPLEKHYGSICSIAFSPDGFRIASGSYDHTVCVWDSTTGEVTAGPLEGHTDWVRSVAFSPDGKCIASASDDRTILIWDSTSGALLVGPLMGHINFVSTIAFSPDGRNIASGSNDKTIRIWDSGTGEMVAGPFRGHTDWIRSVAFSPNGRQIASGSNDHTVRIWDLRIGVTAAERPHDHGHTGGVGSVSFSHDGKYIASGSSDETIRIWDSMSGAMVAGPLRGHADEVNSVAFSPGGHLIASGSDDGTVRIWDRRETGEAALRSSFEHADMVLSISFAPDGKRIASGSMDATVRIWDSLSGQLAVGPLKGHTDAVSSVAFSPDGRSIASSSVDRTVRIWDAKTGAVMAGPLVGHKDSVLSVAFSPDGLRVASGSQDETIRVWDATTGSPVAGPFRGHSRDVKSVAFSPDGEYLASGSWDRTIRVWDSRTGETVAGPFQGHMHWVQSIAFSPDGRFVASGSDDRTVRLWKITIGEKGTGATRGRVLHPPPTADVDEPSDNSLPITRAQSKASLTTGNPLSFGSWQSRDDGDVGWIRGPGDELVMWVPEVHRAGLYFPGSAWVAGAHETELDLDRFAHGSNWEKCYVQGL